MASRGEASIGGLRFGELYRRLTQRKAVTNRWAVLQFLSALQDTAKIRMDAFAGSIAVQESAVRVPDIASSRPPQADKAETESSAMLESVIGSALQLRISGVQSSYKKSSTEGASFEVAENVLLRDVVFAMQGIDGTYVKFDKAEDAFVVGRQHGVPNAKRDLIGRICESGCVFHVYACTLLFRKFQVVYGKYTALVCELPSSCRHTQGMQACNARNSPERAQSHKCRIAEASSYSHACTWHSHIQHTR